MPATPVQGANRGAWTSVPVRRRSSFRRRRRFFSCRSDVTTARRSGPFPAAAAGRGSRCAPASAGNSGRNSGRERPSPLRSQHAPTDTRPGPTQSASTRSTGRSSRRPRFPAPPKGSWMHGGSRPLIHPRGRSAPFSDSWRPSGQATRPGSRARRRAICGRESARTTDGTHSTTSFRRAGFLGYRPCSASCWSRRDHRRGGEKAPTVARGREQPRTQASTTHLLADRPDAGSLPSSDPSHRQDERSATESVAEGVERGARLDRGSSIPGRNPDTGWRVGGQGRVRGFGNR